MVLPAPQKGKDDVKVYITKYALTEGIYEVDGETCESSRSPDMLQVKALGLGCDQYFHGEGKDWHLSKSTAIIRAKQMQAAKLVSIDKQRKRIAALTFE